MREVGCVDGALARVMTRRQLSEVENCEHAARAALVGRKRNHNVGKCEPPEEPQNGGSSDRLERCEIPAPRQCMINGTALDELNH